MTQPDSPDQRHKPHSAMPLAFEAMVRSEGRIWFGYALRALGSREDAEEVVSDACMEMHRRWGKVLLAQNPYALSFKIFLDVLRSRQRERLRPRVQTLPLEDWEPIDGRDAIAEFETRADFEQAMAELERTAPRQAECVRLHHILGLSLEEVAVRLDTTVAAVKSSASRGKQRLCRDHTTTPATGKRGEGGTR
ncbi:hypothetical protein GCM10027168_44930 [Streptomyces capparidis]